MIETPVYLTSTMAVGRIYDGAVSVAIDGDPVVADEVVIPVVGECDDSWLSTAAPVQVEAADAGPRGRRGAPAARSPRARSAPAPAWSASAGRAGSARRAGGVGGARRRRARAGQLRRGARPALRRRPGRPRAARPGRGAASPPAAASRCWRPTCRSTARSSSGSRAAPASGSRAPGSVAHHGSGEIFLAFSDAGRRPRGSGATAPGHPEDGARRRLHGRGRGDRGGGAQRLWAAPDVTGREGRTTPGLPHERCSRCCRRLSWGPARGMPRRPGRRAPQACARRG